MKKTFRTIKARQLTKRNSETGHGYIFARDVDRTADYQGNFYQEDEDWMVWLTTKSGGNLLMWTNMPDEVKFTMQAQPSNVTKISDLPGSCREDNTPEFHISKSKGQIEAELSLARLEAERELENRPAVEVIVTELEALQVEHESLQEAYLELTLENKGLKANLAGLSAIADVVDEDSPQSEIATLGELGEEVEKIEEEEVPKVEDSKKLAIFKEALAKNTKMSKFVKDMKLEFNIEELKEVAIELGLEYDGTKADMIDKFVIKLGE